MKDIDDFLLPEEASEADALEQRIVIDAADETWLDTTYLERLSGRDASEADQIDQATVVPVPEDYGLDG